MRANASLVVTRENSRAQGWYVVIVPPFKINTGFPVRHDLKFVFNQVTALRGRFLLEVHDIGALDAEF